MKAALIFAAALVSCGSPVTPGPVTPPKPSADACEVFCGAARALACPFAEDAPGADGEMGTADDATCEQVCDFTARSGLYASDVDCSAKARTCAALDECAAR